MIQYAERLLETANITYEWERKIRSILYQLEPGRLIKCIDYLKKNQLEPRDPAKQFVSRMKIM
jgi:hypothetical protein